MLPPIGFPVEFDFSLNADMLGFTVLLCCAGSLLTGLAPALHSVRGGLMEALKEGGRSGTPGAGQNRDARTAGGFARWRWRWWRWSVPRCSRAAFRMRGPSVPGFDARNVLFAKYHLDTFCTNSEQRAQFCLRLRDRIGALPGIATVSFANVVPLEIGSGPSSVIQPWKDTLPVRASTCACRAPRSRRDFSTRCAFRCWKGAISRNATTIDSAPVAIVNQTFAQRYFGGRSPVGRRVQVDGTWSTVIGLAKDSKYHRLTEPATPYIYLPYRQRHGGEFWTAFLHPDGGSGARVHSAPSAARPPRSNPNAGVAEVVEFEEIVAGSLYAQKVAAALLACSARCRCC